MIQRVLENAHGRSNHMNPYFSIMCVLGKRRCDKAEAFNQIFKRHVDNLAKPIHVNIVYTIAIAGLRAWEHQLKTTL